MVNILEYGFAALDELLRIVEMKLAMFPEAGHAELLAPNAEIVILEDYHKLYKKEAAVHFVARANGRIVATVGVFIKSDIPYRYFTQSFYKIIGDVYTKPAYRRKGVATKLNREVLKWLNSRGIKSVRLLASDAARPIYERLGFSASDELVLTFAK